MGKKTIICFLLCTYLTHNICMHCLCWSFLFLFLLQITVLCMYSSRLVPASAESKDKMTERSESKIRKRNEKKNNEKIYIILIGSVTEPIVLRKRSCDARRGVKDFLPVKWRVWPGTGQGSVRGCDTVIQHGFLFSRSHGCRHDLGMERIVLNREGEKSSDDEIILVIRGFFFGVCWCQYKTLVVSRLILGLVGKQAYISWTYYSTRSRAFV